MKTKKKIFNSLDPNYKKIIKQDMTTKEDLLLLVDKINLKGLKINWVRDYIPDPNIKQILNLGNDIIGGTHWVSTYKNYYFDPFGLPPANSKLSNLQWVKFHIQDQKRGSCGQYCLLWLYYMSIGEQDKFYNLFCIQ